jgi:hypothetical protein
MSGPEVRHSAFIGRIALQIFCHFLAMNFIQLAMTPQVQQFCRIALAWSGFNKQDYLDALAGIRIFPCQVLGWRRPFSIK